MIANITTGSFLKPLLNYNQKKVKQGLAKVLLVDNVYDESEKTAQSLMLSISNNSKRKDKFFHVSLNYPSNDKSLLTDNNMILMAKDYMRDMGFPEDQPMVVYRHDDTQHPHLHIVTSKILTTGKCLPDGNYKYKSQAITRKLEKKYALTQLSNAKKDNLVINKTNNLKNDIKGAIADINVTYHPQSIQELNQYLNRVQLGLTVLPKENNQNFNDETSNLVYHRVGENGKRLDKGIKSSSFGKDYQHQNLVKSTNLAPNLNATKIEVRKKISSILNRYELLDIALFESLLIKKDITLYYKHDSNKNLVGISFTDNNSGIKYTGENLGVKFKSRVLSQKLSIGNTILIPKEITRQSIAPLRKGLSAMDIGPLLKQLTNMGYHIHEEKDKLYVSDFRNTSGKGYIPLRKLSQPVNHNIVKISISSNENNFLSKKIKNYFINMRKDFAESITYSNKTKNLNSTDIINKNDILKGIRQSASVNTNDQIPLEQLSDIDKKKRKKKGRTI
jgi:hypothetical protein